MQYTSPFGASTAPWYFHVPSSAALGRARPSGPAYAFIASTAPVDGVSVEGDAVVGDPVVGTAVEGAAVVGVAVGAGE